MKRPNVIFVFSDQHRAQACGYAGDPNVKTPAMDRLAAEGVCFTTAISGMPVCCPYRATFMTGQYPHHHGVFLNDLCLTTDAKCIGQAFLEAGYDTAYIGKWHLYGHGREKPIPASRHLGFEYWKVQECTHDYHRSGYYEGEDPGMRYWQGYDAAAQTEDAIQYVRGRSKAEQEGKPFFLVLSFGPPHDPYDTAPKRFRAMYPPESLTLRENVPEYQKKAAREELSGYYAHISALDECLGRLMNEVKDCGIWEDTVFIYTSDHGDMLHSQGVCLKQKPWEESIRVPLLIRYPRGRRDPGRTDLPVNSPDLMPTLLDLCRIPIPDTVDGKSFAGEILAPGREEGDCGKIPADGIGCGRISAMAGAKNAAGREQEEGVASGRAQGDDFLPAVLLQCISPSGEWHKFKGGRPYRGIRTPRYTYVRDLNGPWLLYDNREDPYQLRNLVEEGGFRELMERLGEILCHVMREAGDELLPADVYLKKWGYQVDFLGTNLYDT